MDASQENTQTAQNETIIAPAPANDHKEVEKEAWECVVCYEDGKRTGQVTLGCSHTVCLGCLTKIQTTPGYWGQNATPICPCCRRTIRTSDEATPAERANVERLAGIVRNDRQRVAHAQARADHHLAEVARVQVLVDSRLAEANALAEQLGLTALLQERLNAPAPAPVVHHTVANHAMPIPAPAVHQPQAQVGQATARCPGCRTDRVESTIRFRHIPNQQDGETRRLKRCQVCLDTARTARATWVANH